MRRSTRWLAVVLSLAVVLGILTLSAQVKQDPRVPRHPAAGSRTSEDRQPPRPAVPAAESLAAQQEQGGTVPVAPQSWPEVRDWTILANRMERNGDLRLRKVQEDTVLRGRRHERLDQYY
jgi:hypothetical protein